MSDFVVIQFWYCSFYHDVHHFGVEALFAALHRTCASHVPSYSRSGDFRLPRVSLFLITPSSWPRPLPESPCPTQHRPWRTCLRTNSAFRQHMSDIKDDKL